MMQTIFLIYLLFTFSTMKGMVEGDDQKLRIYAVPGQNGCGSEPWYIEKVFEGHQIDITQVPTPDILIDLGQSLCIQPLRKVISKENQKGILYLSSQGSATGLNYLVEDRGNRINAVIIESVLISGNDAICHTIKNHGEDIVQGSSGLPEKPLAYYWLPYMAKTQFPCYWPGGKQVIKSLSAIPTDIPIIIIHSKKDRQLSYGGACALYYGLRDYGNNNVYFISKEGSDHIRIIKDEKDKQAIQYILKRHNILPQDENYMDEDDVDLALYQPNYEQYKHLYDDLLYKEINHERIGYVLIICGVFLLYQFMNLII